MRTYLSLAAFLMLTGPLLADEVKAGAEPADPNPPPPRPAADVRPAVQASNDFACDLYKVLGKDNEGKNVFFSPYSISSALAMTLEGARGQTAEEMGKVLRLPKSLRDDDAMLPWQTGPYHKAFDELNRRYNEKTASLKDQATRAKIATLRKDLDRLNAQVKALEKQNNFGESGKAHQQAQKVAQAINELQAQIDQYELRVANSLWGEKTYPFRKEFAETVAHYYGTGLIRQANFRGDFLGERAKINGWVEEQTKDRIKDLVPKLSPEEGNLVRLILVNAIYFKGQWSLPFEEKLTKKEDFTLADGGKTQVQMMNLFHSKAKYAAFDRDGQYFDTPQVIPFGDQKVKTYPDGDGFLVLEMPVKGDKLSMVLIAPQNPKGLGAVEAKLTGANLSGWLNRLQKRPVQTAVPRFKMETDYSLGDNLQDMGMKQAFSEKLADFTGMTTSSLPDDRLSISKVLHKAFVECNEKGAEAAAATAVIMIAPSLAPASSPFTPTFRADRPFLFLIRDTQSGAVLFLGRMTQPS